MKELTMKKKLFAFVSILSMLAISVVAQVATNVSWYFYPVSLPDVTTVEFGTARDNLLTGIVMGATLDTHTRVGKPTGIEVRRTFDSTDMTVATNASVNLWRGVFNPPAPYSTMKGQRVYDPVLIIGNGGKVSLDRLSYKVTCGVALLGNESSLSNTTYSVSRVGILAGPDGVLFTPDDTIVKSGAGATLVDAIAFIGGRIGATANVQADLDALDSEIGVDGVTIDFEYQFASTDRTLVGKDRLFLYPRGGIPSGSTAQVVPFVGPQGVVFSVVGPTNTPPLVLQTKRTINGTWSTSTMSAVEGTSVFVSFTRNLTNDQAFARLTGN